MSLRVSGYGIHPQMQPYSSSFRGKTTAQNPKNHVEKRKDTKETEAAGANHDHHSQTVAVTMARGGAHGQAMVVSGRSALVLPECCILCFFLGCGFRLGSSVLHRLIGLVFLALLT